MIKTTRCPQGHEYSTENTYTDKKGYRHCRACARERMRKSRPATGIGAGGLNKAKTHCPKGHEYTEENTSWSKDGKRRACRECARANSKIQNVKVHHITIEERDELVKHQENKCKICKSEFTADAQKCIDHDHSCCPGLYSCGKCIRGILCVDCNVALGRFKDSVNNLKNAIIYLNSNKK